MNPHHVPLRQSDVEVTRPGVRRGVGRRELRKRTRGIKKTLSKNQWNNPGVSGNLKLVQSQSYCPTEPWSFTKTVGKKVFRENLLTFSP